MVYAVSDTTRREASSRDVGAAARARSRRASRSLAIHWPRVIALGLNTAIWIVIVAVALRGLHG